MPTLGLTVQRLEAGQKTRRWRTNANTSFCIMGGSGVSFIDGEKIEWGFGDIFVAPTWRWIEHHVETRRADLFDVRRAAVEVGAVLQVSGRLIGGESPVQPRTTGSTSRASSSIEFATFA